MRTATITLVVHLTLGCAAAMSAEKSSQTTKALIEDIENARTIVFACCHCDDEILVSGLLALASLRFGKDVYVISRTGRAMAFGPGGGGLAERHRDNEKMKEFLRLRDYIRYDERVQVKPGEQDQRFVEFLREFILDKNVDILVSLDPVCGFNGHPQHIALAKQLKELVERMAEEDEQVVKLFYAINNNPRFAGMQRARVKRLPYTDAIDMDAEYVKVPDSRRMSLWEVKYQVLGIYQDTVPPAFRFYNNGDPTLWNRMFDHKEVYQRASSP